MLFTKFGAMSMYGSVIALFSRIITGAKLVDLAAPLVPGRYLVVDGGRNGSTNAHLETLDASVPRYRLWRGQSYRVDLVAVKAPIKGVYTFVRLAHSPMFEEPGRRGEILRGDVLMGRTYLSDGAGQR